MADDLMILPTSALAAAKQRTDRKGHHGYPGRGPAGETCGSCEHYTHNDGGTAKAYRKCRLAKARWTGGPGSDVRKKDPACEFWKAKDTL